MKKERTAKKKYYDNFWKTTRKKVYEAKKTFDALVSAVFSSK